jgi:phospholipid-binding lipoprotein MlaA
VLNDLLQLRIDDAAQNTLRFAINSTIGIGGLLDPATAIGLPAAETDFGETMHVYGLGEGDYHVLPSSARRRRAIPSASSSISR